MENILYARVFHSRQWSNYNLYQGRQVLLEYVIVTPLSTMEYTSVASVFW